jgi:AraC-like DNA-binding protein
MKMSESRFSVVFSKIMNESPMTYVRNYKLREARVLMLANGLNVKEAAAAIGFCDEFHFSKMFKKHFGVSPTDC